MKWYIPEFVKRGLRRLLNHPPGVRMGANSKFLRPFHVSNPDRIVIGDRTLIQPHSRLQPIVTYHSQRFNPSIRVGDGVYIGLNAYIAAALGVVIEDGCVLSDYVYINDTLAEMKHRSLLFS